ncbi:glycoside hydrolase family 26 protein [Streptomyces sp. NPDC017979]|uniref:glycoside hydrolase family 26 protein n=1 Tax=Streptomyces sp. NPDC017979 TaxID=3365024 RepID=UPI0037BC49BF
MPSGPAETSAHRTPPAERPQPRSRTRRRALGAAVLAGALLLGAVALGREAAPSDGARPPADSPECRVTELLVPPCGAWFGAYVRHEKPELVEKVAAYERRIGRKLDIVYAYHDMSTDGLEGQLVTEQERAVGQERMLLLSWESKWWGGTAAQQPRWTQISAGALDATVIDVQARRIKEYGRPLFLSFDLEMDTRVPDEGTPEQFVAAWRHIHDRFRKLGVTNVVWTWTITGYPGNNELFPKLYPGDAYVDWIAYDRYNYYRCHDTEWESFAETQEVVHRWIRQHLSADKPLMLAEFGTADDPDRPQRQAEWYEEVPRVVKKMDGVHAALQWNWRDPGPHCDLSLARESSWRALRKAVADPFFHQVRPW